MQRARVAAVDRPPARAARAARRRARARASTSSSTSTPSARSASIVDCVSPARPKSRMPLSPSATAPNSTRAVRDRLRRRAPRRPRRAPPPGSTLTQTTVAHQRRERADLVGEVGKSATGICCAASHSACSGSRVHLDDDPVGARRDRGARERQHEVAPAGRVRRVDDHRQVRLLLQHGDRADVEREARRRLERLDPALAEDHLRRSPP